MSAFQRTSSLVIACLLTQHVGAASCSGRWSVAAEAKQSKQQQQPQRAAPITTRALEFLGLKARQVGGGDGEGGRGPGASNAVPLDRGSQSLQRIRQRTREAADAARSAEQALGSSSSSTQVQAGALQRKLAAIERELQEAVTAAAAAGMTDSSAVPLLRLPAWLTAAAQPPPPVLLPTRSTCEVAHRAEGSGYEILLQGFNWDSCKRDWWAHVAEQAESIAECGFTTVWLPPPSDSVSREGYMPRDLYVLDSHYGSEEGLRRAVRALQAAGLKVLADAVLNHRCAHSQDSEGTWNQFGGRLAWDSSAIVSDDRNFRGRGNPSSGDSFGAAPNIDHSQAFVRADITEWMLWLRSHVGFDGYRFDFVRGFSGVHVAEYLATTGSAFTVGEYWDSLQYSGGVPHYNQDAHRQRTVDWIKAAGGMATAFDVTTKGILHTVFEKKEYWRLKDAEGKPPGLMGWWPSRATTFLENHDTGSSQGHWRFPSKGVEQGYVYLLTHPGTPCVFWDHLQESRLRPVLRRLIAIRQQAGIHCRSSVAIIKAENDVYAAQIDDGLLMKIGSGDFTPEACWREVDSGLRWTIWSRT